MSWLDEIFREPAPIYGQFVRRVRPLGDWPRDKQPRDEHGHLASRFSAEELDAIQRGEVTLNQALEMGMSSSHYYRIRKVRELTHAELNRVGGY